MKYIDAKTLLQKAVEVGVLKTDGKGNIAVYMEFDDSEKNGWYYRGEEDIIQEIMRCDEAQELIKSAIKEKIGS